jgi:hypothetical protein
MKTKSKQRSTSTRTEEPHKNSKINAVKEETSEIATPYSRLVVQSQNTGCSNHDASNNAMGHHEKSADQEQQEEQC